MRGIGLGVTGRHRGQIFAPGFDLQQPTEIGAAGLAEVIILPKNRRGIAVSISQHDPIRILFESDANA